MDKITYGGKPAKLIFKCYDCGKVNEFTECGINYLVCKSCGGPLGFKAGELLDEPTD